MSRKKDATEKYGRVPKYRQFGQVNFARSGKEIRLNLVLGIYCRGPDRRELDEMVSACDGFGDLQKDLLSGGSFLAGFRTATEFT